MRMGGRIAGGEGCRGGGFGRAWWRMSGSQDGAGRSVLWLRDGKPGVCPIGRFGRSYGVELRGCEYVAIAGGTRLRSAPRILEKVIARDLPHARASSSLSRLLYPKFHQNNPPKNCKKKLQHQHGPPQPRKSILFLGGFCCCRELNHSPLVTLVWRCKHSSSRQ